MELSTEATEMNNVTFNNGNLVSLATGIYLNRSAVDVIQTLYLETCPLGQQQYLAALVVLGTLFSWQLRTTLLFWHLKDNELHTWHTCSFLGNFIKRLTGQY